MNSLYKVLVCFVLLGLVNNLTAQNVIEHDIEDGSLTIPGASTDDYIITGTSQVNYVVVETGYRGTITLRNLNITLDITQALQDAWDEWQDNLNKLRQSPEYLKLKEEEQELYQKWEDRKKEDDYLDIEEEIDNLNEDLDERKEQPDYKDLEEQLRDAEDELNDLIDRRNNVHQEPAYQALQKEVQDLWQQLTNDDEWKDLNAQQQAKLQEYLDVFNGENFPGKAEVLAQLLQDQHDLEFQKSQLPLAIEQNQKQNELNSLFWDLYNDFDDAIKDSEEEIENIKEELEELVRDIKEEIEQKEQDKYALELPFLVPLWDKQREIADMERALEDDYNIKVQELPKVMSNSPISVKGQHNQTNEYPITIVDFILEGDNVLLYTGTLGYPAFHVEQGAQINISAIDPSDNNSGTLSATVANEDGGAGIGAANHERFTKSPYNFDSGSSHFVDAISNIEAIAIAKEIIGVGCNPQRTAGGNIVISSGTVTAKGGHGAGIGGGWGTYYDGMIVIYGGIVDASAIAHAAGIGSGCPTGRGVLNCYTSNSAIIVLPPAQITAAGAGVGNNLGENAYVRNPEIALAGAYPIVYIGDPEKPIVTVRTIDYEQYANIYVDLSLSPDVADVIYLTVPADRLDINQLWFGQTDIDDDGLITFKFHGVLDERNDITFFTDAVSSKPETYGRPHIPETVKLPDGDNVDREVILKLLQTDLSIDAVPSIALCEGYSTDKALENAFRVRISYLDVIDITNVKFELAEGNDFMAGDMKFYDSDGITEISPPTSLTNGDVIYIDVPIQTGKTQDIYSDVFLFSGIWNGIPTGYLRQIVTQSVGILEVSATANPPEGGETTGSGEYSCNEYVTLTATPNEGYNFVNWTRGGVSVSTNPSYGFTLAEGAILIANFALKNHNVSVSANSLEGTVSGGGNYTHGSTVTVSATSNSGYIFGSWTENGVEVSTDASYTFTITGPRDLVANFREFFRVNVDVNNSEYGSATGANDYPHGATAQVEAFVNSCYRFINWTVDGVVVSTDNPYIFNVTSDVNLIANFYALDFDTYSPTLWDNTFMLNLKKLREDGYEVTGCKWFKNGTEERDTRTIDEFSYSAGANAADKLELAPTIYMFQLITANFGTLCSTTKSILLYSYTGKSAESELQAYPNPLPSGSQITIEGVTEGSMIYVYNQSGVRVSSVIANGSAVTLTLPVTGGVYLIRNGDKAIKIVVTN